MCFHKKLAFDGCTQGDKCFLKCVFICSTSVWTSWIARFHYNNYRFRVCDLNIPRSSLCSVVLTHVLLKLTQSPGEVAEQDERELTAVLRVQLFSGPKLSYLSVARLSVTPRFVRQCLCWNHAWRAVLSRHSRSTVTQPLGSPCPVGK